jgi:hypothetical protein
MDKPAFAITWGQIAEEIAHTLADHGLPPDRLEEDFLIDLRKESRKFFRTMMYFSGEVLSVVLQRITRPSQPSQHRILIMMTKVLSRSNTKTQSAWGMMRLTGRMVVLLQICLTNFNHDETRRG